MQCKQQRISGRATPLRFKLAEPAPRAVASLAPPPAAATNAAAAAAVSAQATGQRL
jgi:hypothetical protein